MTSVDIDTLRVAALDTFPDMPDELVDLFIDVVVEGVAQRQLFMTLDKPYGTNNIVAMEDAFGVSCARLEPGQSTSLHHHGTRREFFAVRSGELHLTNGSTEIVLSPGMWARSTPGIAHQLKNRDAARDCEVVEIFSPALLNDKVRLVDPYSRAIGQVTYKE